MLKVGDKRRVRGDLVVGEYYNGVQFTAIMANRICKDVTIKHIYGDQPSFCEISETKDGDFLWTEAMFEPVPVDDWEEMEKAFVKWMRKTFGYKDKMNHCEYMNFNYHKFKIFKAGAEWQRGRGEKP